MAEYVSGDPFGPSPIVFRCRWGEHFAFLKRLSETPMAHPFLPGYHVHHVDVEKVETGVFLSPPVVPENIKTDIAEIRVWFTKPSWVIKDS